MEQSQKNNKDFFRIISLLLITVVLISLGFLFWQEDNFIAEKQLSISETAGQQKVLSDQEIAELVDGPYDKTDEDRLVFNVSQNTDGPKITKVIIVPQKVQRGQEQYLEIWVNDEQGVASVQTETELDAGFIKKLDMELFEGDAKNGKWRVKWIVINSHDTTYTSKFTAISIDGRISEDYANWIDPCSPLDNSDKNYPSQSNDWEPLNGDVCNVNGVVGTDGGNIVINNDVSFWINSGTTVAFNPGKSITLGNNSVINLAEGAVIQKGYLYVSDFDGDGQAVGATGLPELTSVTTTPSATHYATGRHGLAFGGSWKTRLSAMRPVIQGDCYDSADTEGARNTYYGNTDWFNTPNGRGGTSVTEYDYNCTDAIEYWAAIATINSCTNNWGCWETSSNICSGKRLSSNPDLEYNCSNCGFKYMGGTSWECAYTDSDFNNSACNETFSSCALVPIPARRH